MRARSFWSNTVIGPGLLLASAALATSVPALAQSAQGSVTPYPNACTNVPASESDRAHLIYQAGKVQYDDKNYDAAIAQFREAYKRDCSKHDLLIIISRAYELKGDKAEALKALEMYVERVPQSPDIATHKIGIENLKRQIAASPPPTATAPPPAPTTTAAQPTEVREHTVLPWIVVGIGGAAIVTGAILLVVAPKLPSGCDESSGKCVPTPLPPGTKPDDPVAKAAAAATDANRQSQAGTSVGEKTGGLVTIIAGAGVIGLGLLWHFLEPTGPVEKTGKIEPRLAPAIAPGYAGASLGGSF